jgi:hypothetical protein
MPITGYKENKNDDDDESLDFIELIILSISYVVVFLRIIGVEVRLKFCRRYVNGSILFVVWFPGAFLIRRFSATDKKYVLKAFAIICYLHSWLLYYWWCSYYW